jgi:hypothetical protein
MTIDCRFVIVCAESRSSEECGRADLCSHDAGQDKRTRHGGRVTSLSAQGFLSHALFRACVSESLRLLIPEGMRRHGHDGVPCCTATGVQPRG